jgi:sarcosine oxidase subunit beta
MSDHADVAIIGAGVIGCSVAFHLARRGCTNVLLIDKEPLPGSGSTSKANGGIRAQFTTDVNVAMSLASMDILDALADEIGAPPVYRKAGYLFLTSDPARFSAMKAAVAFQRARGAG